MRWKITCLVRRTGENILWKVWSSVMRNRKIVQMVVTLIDERCFSWLHYEWWSNPKFLRNSCFDSWGIMIDLVWWNCTLVIEGAAKILSLKNTCKIFVALQFSSVLRKFFFFRFWSPKLIWSKSYCRYDPIRIINR